MDNKFIKVLIEEGHTIVGMDAAEALSLLSNEVMSVYIMNGLHRTIEKDILKEDARLCTSSLYKELTTDPAYKTIRDREISYIFSNGMKGRLGADKDININSKNLIRWIDAYVRHPERRTAYEKYFESTRPKPKQLPPKKMTDKDFKRMVRESWDEFCKYKTERQEYIDALENGTIRVSHGDYGLPKSIGEILGMPFSCYDFSKMRIAYLRKSGYAYEKETLVDFFERAYNNGRKFVKINQETLTEKQ